MKYPKPTIHPSTSKLVVRMLYKVKRETGSWSIREVCRRLGVNTKYVYYNIIGGWEPTDKTEKGQEARLKLGLPRLKKKTKNVVSDKPKIEKPDYIKAWDHLPREERHQVIKEYLKWKGSI